MDMSFFHSDGTATKSNHLSGKMWGNLLEPFSDITTNGPAIGDVIPPVKENQ